MKKSEKKYKKVFSTFPDVLKALLVLHCNLKLALYYVQQSGAASQRSVQTSLPRACHGVVTRVEGCGLCSYTWPLSGSGDIVLL